MEQMRAFIRPQNSGVFLSAIGTFFILSLSFHLVSVQPVQAGNLSKNNNHDIISFKGL